MATMYAHIPEIKTGVVFSDPCYDGNVWCQHREDFQASNWFMKLDVTRTEDNILLFDMYLGRPTMCNGVSVEEQEGDLSISFPARYTNENKELGMDTAQIFCGSKENWDMYSEDASIHTGTDGLFGNLVIFRCKGEAEPAGFVLMGSVDADLVSEAELFQHFYAGFDGYEISKEKYEEKANPDSLSYKLCLTREVRHASQVQNVSQDKDKSSRNEPDR